MGQPVTPLQEAQLALVKQAAGALAQDVYLHNGTIICEVAPAGLRELLLALRDDEQAALEVLNYMTAVDYSPKTPRFEVVYELYSLDKHMYTRVKAKLEDTGSEDNLPAIDSVSDIYLSADWHERECYDLMGIVFTGHPDLRRIVLPERWDGHPLRKEYPFDGKKVWKLGTTVIDGAINRPDDLGLTGSAGGPARELPGPAGTAGRPTGSER
jgi:NADH-quinone oxidoreductase subunit C